MSIQLNSIKDERRYRIEVILPRPIISPLTYLVTPLQRKRIQKGSQVLIPLSRTITTGYVVAIDTKSSPPDNSLKNIVDILSEKPVLSPELLELTHDAAQYYQTQWGWIVKAALPPGINPEEVKYIKANRRRPGVDKEESDKTLNPVIKRILDILFHKNKPLTYAELVKQLSDENISWNSIKNMEKKGLIEFEYDVKHHNTRKTQYYRLALTKDAARKTMTSQLRKAPKKAETMEKIIELTCDIPVFGARELNKLLPNASRYLVSLVKENFIVPTDYMEETTSVLAGQDIRSAGFTLMPQQQNAIEQIKNSIGKSFNVFLVHGVTGSGKTEVYMRAAEIALESGFDVLLLVPEIGLTPALIANLKKRFPQKTALLHSGLEKAERLRQWRLARQDQPKLVLGTRSAVFSPIPKPGLIMVDEEHDTSFKQANNPTYNARDVAILRGYNAHCPVIIGSATPSMESYFHAQQKKYHLVSMPSRVDNRPLPPVTIIDMRSRKKIKRRSAIFSEELLTEIQHRQSLGEQALLFVPRRGFFNAMICQSCGFVFMCNRCSVSLTYHKKGDFLKCHYCDRTRKKPVKCPECSETELKGIGVGTQTVEEETLRFFPEARVARLDTDSTRGKQLFTTLRKIALGEVDIIIGTQMITKGHDFANITLVGVLSADSTLYLPDFRASERTFQLLTQVAGRTGRGKRGGKVLIQTYNPGHHCIVAASGHDYTLFYEKEIKFRRSFRFPPFCRMTQIIISGSDQQKVIKAAKDLATQLSKRPSDIDLMGPAPAPLARLKGKYRWQIILKSKSAKLLGDFVSNNITIFYSTSGKSGFSISIDVDPYFVL